MNDGDAANKGDSANEGDGGNQGDCVNEGDSTCVRAESMVEGGAHCWEMGCVTEGSSMTRRRMGEGRV